MTAGNQLVLAPENVGKFQSLEIMLLTYRAYTKYQDIHDQESFRKSGFLYSALQSPNQNCVVTASDIEISSLLNRNPLQQQKIKDFLCNMLECDFLASTTRM